ncbi:hypothetical protein PLESTF_000267000 [Pleodorina starrii]|nr:hypothetical protein PLESTM_001226500 [Pleodorina starrii]GLC65238.1 hypothetical protein PLESTF_000267000 [Pleodorina starrii]
MATSSPAAVAALSPASSAAAAAAGPPRPMPYTAAPWWRQRQRAPPPGLPSTAVATAATAAALAAASKTPCTSRLAVTHGSSASARRLPLRPGLPAGLTPRGRSVLARYFREGDSLGGPGGDVPRPPEPPPPPPAPGAAASTSSGAGDGGAGARPPSPQGNAVPFVASTRQRHHQAAAAAAASPPEALSAAAAAAAARRRAGGGSEEDEAYVGVDEEIRRRAQALREAMFSEAERRAVGLHPDILVENLAAEATVPYDAAGALEPPPARRGDEGEAAGPPSGGAGPYAGLEVEDVDPETGGFTTSRPDVDPAYDDVGRAIRKEQGRRRHPHRSPSALAAEARARKSATAEDMKEKLLDAVPELQDTYRVFGLPAAAARPRGLARRRSVGGGTEAASDEEVEELLESASFGREGAVLLAEEAEEPPEAASALADPLGPPVGGGGGASAAGSPLAALDALEHREVLELLESSGAADTAAADYSNVMPSPLLELHTAAAAAAAGSSGRTPVAAAAAGAGRVRSGFFRRRYAAALPRRRMALRGGGTAAAVRPADHVPQHAAPPAASSGYPPFYHTSPDVPEEDLQQQQQQQRGQRPERRPARRLVSSVATAATAARVARGVGVRHRAAGEPAAVNVGEQAAAAGGAGGGGGSAGGGKAGWLLQPPLYNTSPDVPDYELERTAGGTATAPGMAGHENDDGGRPTAETPQGGDAGSNVEARAQPPPPPPAPSEPSGGQMAAARPPLAPQRAVGRGGRLRSLGDVDRQFIDIDTVGSWDEQANDLRAAMRDSVSKPGRSSSQRQERPATQPPGARGAHSSLQPQTIGIHGNAGGGGGAAAATAGSGTASGAGAGGGGGGGDGRTVTVLRVECVPSQTYGGVARTAAVLAADGQLTLLARPTGPSPERVRAALKLLHMVPDSSDFRTSAAEAAAAAADNDEREAAATEAAAVAAAMAAVGTPGMEAEAQHRPASAAPLVDERELQSGLILGQSEIDPEEVMADPNFPLESSWSDHRDPHDPHVLPLMAEGEGHMLGLQANIWHEDYDEVMGQIYDGQRSGWSEDAVNGGFDSDVY